VAALIAGQLDDLAGGGVTDVNVASCKLRRSPNEGQKLTRAIGGQRGRCVHLCAGSPVGSLVPSEFIKESWGCRRGADEGDSLAGFGIPTGGNVAPLAMVRRLGRPPYEVGYIKLGMPCIEGKK